jgi:hypothetical protein
MGADKKLEIAKELLEEGKIKTFGGIFDYVSKTSISAKLGINYKRFLRLAANPIQIKYRETYSIAKLLGVDPKLISGIIHSHIDSQTKPKKAKPK